MPSSFNPGGSGLPLTGGTLTGGLAINPGSGVVLHLDVDGSAHFGSGAISFGSDGVVGGYSLEGRGDDISLKDLAFTLGGLFDSSGFVANATSARQLDGGGPTFGHGAGGWSPLTNERISSNNTYTYFDDSGFVGNGAGLTYVAGTLTIDTGWTGNADAGDKTQVIPAAANLATIAAALNIVATGAGTAFLAVAEKCKSLETALAQLLAPNA